jgi:hypothetical protein
MPTNAVAPEHQGIQEAEDIHTAATNARWKFIAGLTATLILISLVYFYVRRTTNGVATSRMLITCAQDLTASACGTDMQNFISTLDNANYPGLNAAMATLLAGGISLFYRHRISENENPNRYVSGAMALGTLIGVGLCLGLCYLYSLTLQDLYEHVNSNFPPEDRLLVSDVNIGNISALIGNCIMIGSLLVGYFGSLIHLTTSPANDPEAQNLLANTRRRSTTGWNQQSTPSAPPAGTTNGANSIIETVRAATIGIGAGLGGSPIGF